MAVMSDADRNKAARIVARQWAQDNTATVTHADYLAAVAAMDDALEGPASALNGTSGQALAVRLNAALPDPFSGVSQPLKSLLFAVTIGVKYGYLSAGGD